MSHFISLPAGPLRRGHVDRGGVLHVHLRQGPAGEVQGGDVAHARGPAARQVPVRGAGAGAHLHGAPGLQVGGVIEGDTELFRFGSAHRMVLKIVVKLMQNYLILITSITYLNGVLG